jgi:protein-S-isoprenylcysteine O-methyltransferase Ste14
MVLFLVPLLVGFAFNSASAFTAAYSARLGGRGGQLVSVLLRDVLGIPVWVLGLALAVRASASQLVAANAVSNVFSWFLLAAGSCLQVWAFVFIRVRALAPTDRDSLVRQGPYARIRHPMYTGLLCQLAGLALYVPTLPVILACLIGVGWTFLQARLEERDLLRRVPGYGEYMQQVPRFFPRLRRK